MQIFTVSDETLADKTINIQIDQNDLTQLKDGHYMLCFAKKIKNQNYNIIWQAYWDYMVNNQIHYYPQYAAFGSQYFENIAKVFISTNIVQIKSGEKTTVNNVGILSNPVEGGDPQALNYDNQYNGIHLGVSQTIYGITGKKTCSPIFLSVNKLIPGLCKYIPENKVLVWFEQNVSTGIMSSNLCEYPKEESMSSTKEIDLEDTNIANLKYTNGKWITY